MPYKNLLSLKELSDAELNQLLDVATEMKRLVLSRVKRGPQLLGKVLAILGQYKPLTVSALTLSVQYLSGMHTVLAKDDTTANDIFALKACGVDFIVTSAEENICQDAAKSISGGIVRFGDKNEPLRILALLFTILQQLETLKSIDVSIVGDVEGNFDFVEELCGALLRYDSRVSIFASGRNLFGISKYKNLRVYNDISMAISGADFIINVSDGQSDSKSNLAFFGDTMGLSLDVVKLAQQNVPMLFAPKLFDKENLCYVDYFGNISDKYYSNLTAMVMSAMYLLNRN